MRIFAVIRGARVSPAVIRALIGVVALVVVFLFACGYPVIAIWLGLMAVVSLNVAAAARVSGIKSPWQRRRE